MSCDDASGECRVYRRDGGQRPSSEDDEQRRLRLAHEDMLDLIRWGSDGGANLD